MRGIGKAAFGSMLSLGLVFAATDAVAQVGGDQLTGSSDQITIQLEAVGPAEASGAAVLSAADGQTRVALDVSGAPAESELSGVLVAGGCSQPGEVIAELPIAVEIRQADSSIACGEHIAAADAQGTPPANEPMPDPIPLDDDPQSDAPTSDAPTSDPFGDPAPTDPLQ